MSGTTVREAVATQPARLTIEPPGMWKQVRTHVWRNIKHIRRMPEMLADVTFQPIMFVVLFAYVFGGSINAGVNYREWLLPGIMAQTMAFSCFVVAIGLTNDLNKGIVDRFRSLPISRSSVLIGRSISSLIHSSIGTVVMAVTGLLIGWRIHTGFAKGLLGFALLLLFGFAMMWIGILAGSRLKTAEAVQGVMFTAIFPLTFLADTFAPTANMNPAWLRTIAEWNPISSLVRAMRELWGNTVPLPPDSALPLQHPVLATVLWSVLLTVILAPLSIRAFNHRTSE
ncbi:ABC transporter permease [Terrabacter terrigena]|uniref:Transport permease protein n=1 Tax=Terrabacter terrigena TaxID=574718 RepID=A0ABW3MZE1_9MICO